MVQNSYDRVYMRK